MAVPFKKKKKSKKVKKFSKEIAYLEKLIKISLSCVNGQSDHLDSLFTKQADKLKEEMKKLE